MQFADSSGQAKLVKEGRLALAQAYMKEQSFELALEEARTGTIDARKIETLEDAWFSFVTAKRLCITRRIQKSLRYSICYAAAA